MGAHSVWELWGLAGEGWPRTVLDCPIRYYPNLMISELKQCRSWLGFFLFCMQVVRMLQESHKIKSDGCLSVQVYLFKPNVEYLPVNLGSSQFTRSVHVFGKLFNAACLKHKCLLYSFNSPFLALAHSSIVLDLAKSTKDQIYSQF